MEKKKGPITKRERIAFSSTIAAIAILFLLSYSNFAGIAATVQGMGTPPIDHIVVIMQENRTFDNYFGTYPGANGIPPGLCMPIDPGHPKNGCVKPWLSTYPKQSNDLPHYWSSSHIAYDNGKMDGFIEASENVKNYSYVMSYYDNKTIPNYWDYASHFVLMDNFFSSALSYSQPNHWYIVAANSPTASLYEQRNVEYRLCHDDPSCAYIQQAQKIATIVDLMTQNSISWNYYDTTLNRNLSQAISDGSAFSYWNIFKSKNSSYTPAYASHFVDRTQFFQDVRSGNLPDVSWVIPSDTLSEHSPANITLGMLWVTKVVNSVMQSQYWKNTAIIVLWDDYGGYFDTVVPPQIDNYGLGFRVPALIISPYAKMGYIDSTTYSFESTLKFIEWRFNLPSLTLRDANANNLLNAFNFAQPPLQPFIIPLSSSENSTIMSLASNNALAPGFIGNNPD